MGGPRVTVYTAVGQWARHTGSCRSRQRRRHPDGPANRWAARASERAGGVLPRQERRRTALARPTKLFCNVIDALYDRTVRQQTASGRLDWPACLPACVVCVVYRPRRTVDAAPPHGRAFSNHKKFTSGEQKRTLSSRDGRRARAACIAEQRAGDARLCSNSHTINNRSRFSIAVSRRAVNTPTYTRDLRSVRVARIYLAHGVYWTLCE